MAHAIKCDRCGRLSEKRYSRAVMPCEIRSPISMGVEPGWEAEDLCLECGESFLAWWNAGRKQADA
jgi:hypothetical protein